MRFWGCALVAGALFATSCSLGSDDATTTTVLPTVSTGPVSSSTPTTEPTASIDEVAPPLLTGELEIEIIATHPHDGAAFTQGLEVIADGRLLESTGLYGESDRRIIDIASGEVRDIVELDASLFGEGLTIVDDELIQLTWKAGLYLRADLTSLSEVSRGTYDGEGWGLCHDDARLVMSDGTPTLTFRNPETFESIGAIDVTLNDQPLTNINELECVNGQVMANIWLSDFIVVIDPNTGRVVATLDGSELRPAGLSADDSSFALNGIAHDPSTGHFFLTGKQWPVLYEVELSSS